MKVKNEERIARIEAINTDFEQYFLTCKHI